MMRYKHLNDYSVAKGLLEYSTYVMGNDYAVDIRDQEGVVIKGFCGFDSEREALARAEHCLVNELSTNNTKGE